MTGLYGSFINFEECGHSNEFYKDGYKFEIEINKEKGCLELQREKLDASKKKWGLAKMMYLKDIFKWHHSADDRYVIVKYCIQDCNLVQYLLNKIDVII